MTCEPWDVNRSGANADEGSHQVDGALVRAGAPHTLARRWLRVAAPESGLGAAHWLMRFSPDGDRLDGRAISFVRIENLAPQSLLAARVGQPDVAGFVLPSLRGMRGEWTAAGVMLRAIAHMSHLSGLTVDLRAQGLTGRDLQVDLEVGAMSLAAALQVEVRVWLA